jgi:hypothetical protein
MTEIRGYMAKTLLPDYKGGSIVNLMSSISARFGLDTGQAQLRALPTGSLEKYKKVILLVLDGLGYHYLMKYGSRTWLKDSLYTKMTSVFPSTTASSITTFATGQPPSHHCITGWFVYLKELGTVSKILFCESRYGGNKFDQAGIDLRNLIASRPISDGMKAKSYVVTPRFIAEGPFSKASRGCAKAVPYEDLSGLLYATGSLLKRAKGDTFIYAYWPEFDHLCHQYGVNSPKVRAHLRELDEKISAFWRLAKRNDSVLLVTADHGLVNTPRERAIELEDHPEIQRCLSMPLCGEPRVVYCYVHPAKAKKFEEYVSRKLSKACRLYSRKQVIAKGFFGQLPADPRLEGRVGDYVLLMNDGWSMKDFIMGEEKYFLKANHGGITEQEMLVPLVKV